MRNRDTRKRPFGLATRREELRQRDESAEHLANLVEGAAERTRVLTRGAGRDLLSEFTRDDLAPRKRDLADLPFVAYAGVR